MKKYFYLFVAALVAVSFASCGENNGKKSGLQFTITEITASSANVAVTPSDTAAYFYYGVAEKAVLDTIADADLVAAIVDNVEYYISLYAQYGYDLTYEDFFDKGEASYNFEDLDPETVYYAYAFYFDLTTKQLVGKVAKQDFMTGARQTSDLQLSLAVAGDVLTVTASNNDPYFCFADTKEQWDQYVPSYFATDTENAEDWAKYVLQQFSAYGYEFSDLINVMYFYNGNQTLSLANDLGLDEDGDYVVFALPFNGSYATGDAVLYALNGYVAPVSAPARNAELKLNLDRKVSHLNVQLKK